MNSKIREKTKFEVENKIQRKWHRRKFILYVICTSEIPIKFDSDPSLAEYTVMNCSSCDETLLEFPLSRLWWYISEKTYNASKYIPRLFINSFFRRYSCIPQKFRILTRIGLQCTSSNHTSTSWKMRIRVTFHFRSTPRFTVLPANSTCY